MGLAALNVDGCSRLRSSDGGASSGSDTAGLRSLRRPRASIDSDGGMIPYLPGQKLAVLRATDEPRGGGFPCR